MPLRFLQHDVQFLFGSRIYIVILLSNSVTEEQGKITCIFNSVYFCHRPTWVVYMSRTRVSESLSLNRFPHLDLFYLFFCSNWGFISLIFMINMFISSENVNIVSIRNRLFTVYVDLRDGMGVEVSAGNKTLLERVRSRSKIIYR